MAQETNNQQEQHEAGFYFNFKEVLTYFFRKKDPNRPTNINLKMMHGINKISMLIFLVCLVVIVARFISRM